MTSLEGTLRSLRSVVGDAHVLTDDDVLASSTTDWTGRFVGSTPALVRPGSTAETAEVMGICRRDRVAIVPQGGNTGLVGGSVPLAGEVVLSTRRLDAISDVDDDAGQLTAGAGVTLAAVQRAARTSGWRYGVDLAARDTATVGGMVATNAGGLRVMRFGATRHQLLGVEAVLGTGAVVRRLGGVVKDNTGFDLGGLLCGSEGTLGVVCHARLALVPPAGPSSTALIGFDSTAHAVESVGLMRRGVPGLEAAEIVFSEGAALVEAQTGVRPVLGSAPPVLVVVEAVGPPDPSDALAAALERAVGVVEVAVATDARRAEALWHVREAQSTSIGRLGVPHKYDVTVPNHRLADFCDDVPGRVAAVAPAAQTWLFGHLADGNIHVNVTGLDGAPAALDEAVLGAVLERGGSISAEHGIGTAKVAWLLRDRGQGDVEAMRAIKRALDPDGICNPNVLLPRPG